MRERGGRKIAHVRLSGFTSGAHGEVRKAVDELLDKGAEGVVLDLRNNGGGLLNEAVLISSIFIPDGTIVSTDGRTRPKRVFEATGDAIDAKIPVVVLVNGESASASEIVTGALQDRDRAEVVGTRTFGKGVFQEVRQLSNGGALDITVGEYFTPERPQPGRRRRQAGRRHPAGRQGGGRPQDQEARRGARRGGQDGRARGDVSRRREAAGAARSAAPPRGRRAGRRGARAPRPLPHRRAVLLPRAADERRQAEGEPARRRRRPRARRADRPARRARARRCGGSAARTSRATCSRR